MERFHWLYTERDLVNDAGKTITRSSEAQQVWVGDLRGFRELARRGDPSNAGYVRTYLAELDPVERIFAMAAGGSAERHVPNFDIGHELQTLRSQSFGCFDELKAGLPSKELLALSIWMTCAIRDMSRIVPSEEAQGVRE